MQKLFLIVIITAFNYTTQAAVDTVSVFSAAMQKNIKCVVIKPERYKAKKQAYPTLYLLHGYGGSYSNWITRVPQLQALATQHRMLIICPDGDFSSWYLDSPIDSSFKYETFTGIELPQFIDVTYNTIKTREGRAITGLSMGGYGAMLIGLRHSKTFAACGSMSGALVLEDLKKSYDMQKRFGDTVTNKQYYINFSINNLIENYPPDSLAIIIDCGVDDAFIKMNSDLHKKMITLKIPHDYIERPGKHDWKYWATAVQYQVLFFKKYFDKAQQNKS